MRTVLLVAALGAILLAGCRREPRLETRTFQLNHLRADVAAEVIGPYVYDDRPGAKGRLSESGSARTITVRETPDNLEKIARVLEQYDRAKPTVALHFQIIEADGGAPRDDAIAEVEQVLRGLFRYQGYRLLADAAIATDAGTMIEQTLSVPGGPFRIGGRVREVQPLGDSAAIGLEVGLLTGDRLLLQTSVNARLGQTVVLGTANPDVRRGALILTVKPTLQRL